MNQLRISALPLIAAATVFSSSAVRAEAWTSYPGASCTSDGAAARPTDGTLLNISPTSSGYTTFSCPVPRSFQTGTNSGPSPTTVFVIVKSTNGSVDFSCKLRAVDFNGAVSDQASFLAPTAAALSSIHTTFWGGELQVNGPFSDQGYSAILRCQVPNYLPAPGGILSYRVRH